MAFKTVNTNDKNLQFIQDNVASALPDDTVTKISVASNSGAQSVSQSQVSHPFLKGNLVTLSLTASQDNLVPHGLRRVPSIWMIARQDTNASVWEKVSTTLNGASATDSYLNLWASSNCNVTVWVS